MKNLCVVVVLKVLAVICRILGRRGSAALGCGLGLLYRGLDTRRGRTLTHLIRALGARRALQVLPRYYEHMGMLVVEYAQLMSLPPAGEVIGSWVDTRGLDAVRRALDGGRGAIILTGHLGNWELTGYAIASVVPLNSLYRPLDNPFLDRTARAIRERSGMRTHQKGDAIRWSLRVLSSHEALGALLDQDGSTLGVFVPAFGRLASTLPTAARLARRTGAAVFPVASHRRRDRISHGLSVGPEILPVDTGDERRDNILMTYRCNRSMERLVLEHPAQWLWSVRRWRTQPTAGDLAAWREAEAYVRAHPELGLG
jgi:KDO2-lipid IV(A) lauroyltransferase